MNRSHLGLVRLFAFGSLALACSSASAQFSDATSGALGDTGFGRGVSWSDFDGDGDPDLYVANSFGANRFLRNDAGNFVEIVTSPGRISSTSLATAWGDFDGDGDPDVYLAETGPNDLFRNDEGSFVEATNGQPLADSGGTFSTSWLDTDGDGDLDLFLPRNGENRILRNSGGVFHDATSPPLDDPGDARGASWSDLDGDGDLDLYLTNRTTANVLFRNDDGSFVDITTPPLDDPGDGRGIAWEDFDADGDLDLYVALFLGTNRFFRNDGGTYVDATTPALADTGNGQTLLAEDFDLDGDLDVYLVNDGTANRLFRNDGGILVDATGTAEGDAGPGIGCAAADYDGDGDLDMYLANSGAANKLFRNDQSTGNRWLRITLRGTISNPDGIGARIRVVAGSLVQSRVVSPGRGYLSQSDAGLHFGLAKHALADTVEVRWPSSIVQTLTSVAVDQHLHVVESGAVGVPFGTLPASRISVVPNPFRDRVEIRLLGRTDSTVGVDVVDVRGRVVRRFATDGSGQLWWDGRDEAGRAMAAGVYLLRVRGDGRRAAHGRVVYQP